MNSSFVQFPDYVWDKHCLIIHPLIHFCYFSASVYMQPNCRCVSFIYRFLSIVSFIASFFVDGMYIYYAKLKFELRLWANPTEKVWKLFHFSLSSRGEQAFSFGSFSSRSLHNKTWGITNFAAIIRDSVSNAMVNDHSAAVFIRPTQSTSCNLVIN